MTLQCTGATVEAPATRPVTPGTATAWNLTGLAAGANCTATEDPASVPPGYTTNNDACSSRSGIGRRYGQLHDDEHGRHGV